MRFIYNKYYCRNFLILFILLLFSGCGKDTRHPVPYVEVDFRINLESTFELQTIGGYANFYGGYRGIVIYRLLEDEFKAFDRACTNDVFEQIVVEDPPVAKCKKCGSTYLLIDGSIIDGPAKHNLKQYSTRFNAPFLHVSN